MNFYTDSPLDYTGKIFSKNMYLGFGFSYESNKDFVIMDIKWRNEGDEYSSGKSFIKIINNDYSDIPWVKYCLKIRVLDKFY